MGDDTESWSYRPISWIYFLLSSILPLDYCCLWTFTSAQQLLSLNFVNTTRNILFSFIRNKNIHVLLSLSLLLLQGMTVQVEYFVLKNPSSYMPLWCLLCNQHQFQPYCSALLHIFLLFRNAFWLISTFKPIFLITSFFMMTFTQKDW